MDTKGTAVHLGRAHHTGGRQNDQGHDQDLMATESDLNLPENDLHLRENALHLQEIENALHLQGIENALHPLEIVNPAIVIRGAATSAVDPGPDLKGHDQRRSRSLTSAHEWRTTRCNEFLSDMEKSRNAMLSRTGGGIK